MLVDIGIFFLAESFPKRGFSGLPEGGTESPRGHVAGGLCEGLAG